MILFDAMNLTNVYSIISIMVPNFKATLLKETYLNMRKTAHNLGKTQGFSYAKILKREK